MLLISTIFLMQYPSCGSQRAFALIMVTCLEFELPNNNLKKKKKRANVMCVTGNKKLKQERLFQCFFIVCISEAGLQLSTILEELGIKYPILQPCEGSLIQLRPHSMNTEQILLFPSAVGTEVLKN